MEIQLSDLIKTNNNQFSELELLKTTKAATIKAFQDEQQNLLKNIRFTHDEVQKRKKIFEKGEEQKRKDEIRKKEEQKREEKKQLIKQGIQMWHI